MSDVASVFRSFISYEEFLSPQFLCPVCGVIICAIIVFCIGVGFKSSSEPKFENAGEGDGVPFIKKKKKLKAATPSSPSPKKASTLPAAKTSKKREDVAPEKPLQSLKFDPKEKDTYEPVVVASNDDWITPVTRKEKKARRRHELTPEKEAETLVQPDGDMVDSRKSAMSVPVETPKRVEAVKTVEPIKPEPPAPQREKKGRTAKTDAAAKVVELPPVEVKVKPVEKSKSEKEDDAKSKKSAKQKAKPVEVPEEPAPTAPPAASTRSKKKKSGASEAPSTAGGGFPLADFELPSSVVVPATAPQRKTPSPPSTDSSFELVDADAVREAIEAEHQEPSKTSGASRRKTKKPAKSSLPAKVEEEVAPVAEAPKRAPVAAPKAEPEKAAASSNLNFDELGGSIDVSSEESYDWQDAKPSRKRRRARRDD